MKKVFFSVLFMLCMAFAAVAMTPVTAMAATDFSGWTKLDSATATIDGGTTGAKYYLDGDVDINTTLTIKGGTAENPVILDLNGHVLKLTGSGSVISVSQHAFFKLSDDNTTADNGYSYTIDSNNTFTLYTPGTGIGTTKITGGIITGGNAAYGGGVAVYGDDFTMTGGNIVGCNATSHGGGVCMPTSVASSNFSMTGGNIVGCNAEYGGGVHSNV